MSAPLVVNTTDGTVWTRRGETRAGLALYAPADVCQCPEFVMATEAELAEHGIAGAADALPVPVGTEPQAQSLPLAVVAELNDLRMRLAGMANPPREVYLALYEGAEPELFTTVEAARECCDDYAKTDAGENYWDWTVNEHGIHIQFWTHADDDRPLSETSGTVTPIVVQGDDDLSELERLRREVESNRVDGQRLLRAEQRRAELEAVLGSHRRDDQAEIEGLRARVAELRAERADERDELAMALGRSSGTEWGDLIEFAAGAVSVEAKLRARITELEAERHSTNEALSKATEALRANRDRIAELEKLVPEPKPKDPRACPSCGSLPESWCPDCAACERGCFGGFDGNGCTHANALWGRRTADGITRVIAPTQALREDGEHYAAVHHDYRTGRDLPELGGES